jgi:hypothetical protein
MVTIDELVAVKVQNAEADEQLWSSFRAMHEEQAEGLEQVAASAASGIAANRSAADDAAAEAAEAKERVERLKRGEDVPGGLGEPLDPEKMLRKMGFKTADLNHMRTTAALPGNAIPILAREGVIASERATRRLARRLRRLIDSDDG